MGAAGVARDMSVAEAVAWRPQAGVVGFTTVGERAEEVARVEGGGMDARVGQVWEVAAAVTAAALRRDGKWSSPDWSGHRGGRGVGSQRRR